MNEDLRGVFYILKGQYKHHLEPAWTNPVTETTNWCGGFDPSLSTTEEWYMLVDSLTLTCHRASSDLDLVVRGVEYTITKYKTREHFERVMRSLNFGVASKSTKALDEHLIHLYGHHFTALVKEQEDLAYKHLRENHPALKARKKLHRRSAPVEMVNTTPATIPAPKGDGVNTTPRKKKALRPRHRKVQVEFE